MNLSPEDRVIDAALSLVARRAGVHVGSIRILVKTDTGYRYDTCLPAGLMSRPVPAVPVQEPGDQRPLAGCPREIIDTLREVGHRLTSTQLAAEMSRRGLDRSETAIKNAAGTMVDMGALTNDPAANPRGYGLPEWANS